MSNAGYGNHDAPPPAAANVDVKKPDVDAAKDGTNAAPPATDRRDSSTPGDGALPDGAQGDDVDPGVG